MSSLGGTLLSCRGAAATAGTRAAVKSRGSEARSEPWDLTGDADFGVAINVAPVPSQMREQALVPEPRAGGNKQRSAELTCQEPPPRSQPAVSPQDAGLGVSTDPPTPSRGAPKSHLQPLEVQPFTFPAGTDPRLCGSPSPLRSPRRYPA